MEQEVRLAELLCTRLCHDLTGPIGAVNNGAEFLSEEGFELQHQAVDLIVSSAQQAVTRLQFYRQAYGKVNDHGEASLTELRDLVQKFFKETRLELDWPDCYTDAAGVSTSRRMAQLILNMLVMAAATLPRGGVISVSVVANGELKSEVSISAKADTVRFDDESKAAFLLQSSIDAITPKTVQPYFTMRLAQQIGVRLSHNTEPGVVRLVAVHD